MGAEIELHRLVDLALRSPDVGVVNFNHLHTLLHAILNHIGLSYDPFSGVLNKQLTVPAGEGNNKSSKSEQSTAEDETVTEPDRLNLADSGKETSDDNIVRDSDPERSNFARLGNRFVCNKFVKLQLFEYANNLSC